jgi:hypothetical protein
MSSVNDSPNHFVVPDAISRGMKPVGKLARVTRLDKDLLEMMVKRPRLSAAKGDCRKEGLFRRQEGEKQ